MPENKDDKESLMRNPKVKRQRVEKNHCDCKRGKKGAPCATLIDSID